MNAILPPVMTTNIAYQTAVSDEIIVNRDGSTGVQATTDLAVQLAATSPLDLAGFQAPLFATEVALKAAILTDKVSAWVFNDPDADNNGVWSWTGDEWVWTLPLPYSISVLHNAGAGSANSILATSKVPLIEGLVVVLPITETNTTSPVSVTVNGQKTFTIKTMTGFDISEGGLVEGMMLIALVADSVLRLLSDQTSIAVLAAAEAAAARAESAASGVVSMATFKTVTALIDDNREVLSYSVGAEFVVSDGSRVEAGPFVYEVLSPLRNDWHVSTAGGVLLQQINGHNGGVNIRAFGADTSKTNNYPFIQRALDTGRTVYIDFGAYAILNDELEIITRGQRFVGVGMGFGYTGNTAQWVNGAITPSWSSPVFNWQDASTLLFKGVGTKRIRTRIRHRASAADPQDSPLSVALNIQNDGVQIEGVAIRLYVEPPAGGPASELTDSVDNLGADYDVGIFIGSRLGVSLRRVASIGYFRMAEIWGDNTQSELTPRFSSPRGFEYPQGVARTGGDGCLMDQVFTAGGRWGVNIQGAKPATGGTDYGPAYYDQLRGETVADTRGLWGWSDFQMINCQIFGGTHHTRKRLFDMKASPSVADDWDVGGAFNIDGLAVNGNKAIHGHRYINCRFQSYAPFCVRIDRSARDAFFGCMIENPQPYVMKHDGTIIGEADATNCFGGLASTTNHNLLSILESQVPFFSTWLPIKYGDTILSNSSLSNRYFRTPYNEARFLSDVQATTSRIYLGYDANPTAVTISRSPSNSLLIATSNAFSVLNTSGTTLFSIPATGNAVFYGNAYPNADNAHSIGQASNRFSVVYAATSTINTSDAMLKALRDGSPVNEDWQVSSLTDAELAASAQIAKEIGVFKFKDAVREKGEAARLHVGLTVQRVIEIMEAHHLEPFAYSFICFDEWNAEEEVRDIIEEHVDDGITVGKLPDGVLLRLDDGQIVTLPDARLPIDHLVPPNTVVLKEVVIHPTKAAGSVYSFRDSGLQYFILRGQEQRLSNMEKHLGMN
ncbi:hypothetical protein DSM25558_4967 [Agrobacterium sp. DSM 25558]|uniref:tail fiber domain-containing protein n=1 Tax=Agrobacterium sp. DSM 25558 TaxID=1907665 RepID=UPI00097246EC|nr:tail fiber domain-containing protein [Agrobacterium sp. DSM 25558]SCX30474.1 hypothetical protein DSM25558_4967 [Agrobacterium sp. DSM 25558]